jgi:membrane protein involved in colicin uptake
MPETDMGPDNSEYDIGRGPVVTKEKKDKIAEILKGLGFSSEKQFREAVKGMEMERIVRQDKERRQREMAKLRTEIDQKSVEELARRFSELKRKNADRMRDISTTF